MNTVQKMNEEYAKLCQVLGDLYIKRDKLDLSIKDIKKAIDGLNEAVSAIKALEAKNKQQESLKKQLEEAIGPGATV